MAKLAKEQAKVPLVETRRMALAELLPADYNPRRINDKAMKGLRASLERFGELGGIVYNEQTGRLVGGHQRVKALAALGVADAEVRVVSIPLAEEKAAKLGVKLVFPIFFCILPSLFVVTVGPMAVKIIRELLPLMNSV